MHVQVSLVKLERHTGCVGITYTRYTGSVEMTYSARFGLDDVVLDRCNSNVAFRWHYGLGRVRTTCARSWVAVSIYWLGYDFRKMIDAKRPTGLLSLT